MMKRRTAIQLGAALAATFIFKFNVTAQGVDPWQTIDDFQLQDGCTATAGDITVAPLSGTVFAVGSGKTTAKPDPTAVINVSPDHGLNWTVADTYDEPGWPWAHFRGVAADALGRVFAAGELYNSVGPQKAWIVHESLDGGGTWATSDFFRIQEPNSINTCGDIKVAPNGDVYAAGFYSTSTTAAWIVRRRAMGESGFSTVDSFSNGGGYEARMIAFHPTAGVLVAGSRWTVRQSATGAPGTWRTIDTFPEATGAYAEGITVDPTGKIYVVGRFFESIKVKNKTTTTTYWAVRRSTNGGSTWTTVDKFAGGPVGVEISALAPGVDSAGVVFVSGYTPNGWLVRKGTTAANGAMIWTNSDVFQMAPGRFGRGNGLVVDLNDDVYVTGSAQDALGIDHWITRKLAR